MHVPRLDDDHRQLAILQLARQPDADRGGFDADPFDAGIVGQDRRDRLGIGRHFRFAHALSIGVDNAHAGLFQRYVQSNMQVHRKAS